MLLSRFSGSDLAFCLVLCVSGSFSILWKGFVEGLFALSLNLAAHPFASLCNMRVKCECQATALSHTVVSDIKHCKVCVSDRTKDSVGVFSFGKKYVVVLVMVGFN